MAGTRPEYCLCTLKLERFGSGVENRACTSLRMKSPCRAVQQEDRAGNSEDMGSGLWPELANCGIGQVSCFCFNLPFL